MTRTLHTEVKSGERLMATDITDLTFFPKGTILIFSTEAYNATSPAFKNIWKICNTANHAANPTVPDLTNKFLRGAENSGETGDGKKKLSIDEMPEHGHGVTDNEHVHTTKSVFLSAGGNVAFSKGVLVDPAFSFPGINVTGAGSVASSKANISINSSGSGEAFDVIPAFYAVIYIMKIA
jgi:hypothetical protein